MRKGGLRAILRRPTKREPRAVRHRADVRTIAWTPLLADQGSERSATNAGSSSLRSADVATSLGATSAGGRTLLAMIHRMTGALLRAGRADFRAEDAKAGREIGIP